MIDDLRFHVHHIKLFENNQPLVVLHMKISVSIIEEKTVLKDNSHNFTC